MSTATDPSLIPAPVIPPPAFPAHWTMEDLQQHLGGVSLNRIRLYPPPGMATEADALWLDDHEDCLCELVDGVLVEKEMSFFESMLAMMLGHILFEYLDKNNIGVVSGADGQIRLLPSKMRVPDVAFIRWESFPEGKLPEDQVCRTAPDLAVEVLSKGNTKKEMELKLDEYFEAGVRLVWYIDPKPRTACIYTARDQMTTIGLDGNLEGGDVLPGFSLRLGELFERADRKLTPPKS